MHKERKIFEEVDSPAIEADRNPNSRIGGGESGNRQGIRIWLGILLILVMGTLFSGGLTRLTDSGLAITDWNPVVGAIPPLSTDAWETEFAKYKAIPEYDLQNKEIELSEFKKLYWWEWSHRQLARLAGIAWLAGFAWFLFRRNIPRGWAPRLILLGVLGGAQAAVGWWMVSSGLQGRMVDVASYRLAVHLALAFGIIASIFWFMLALARREADLLQSRRARDRKADFLSSALIGVFFLQIVLGALVAGIDAGQGFPTWPLMNGEFVPSEALGFEPLWTNFFENQALVHFNHRIFGYALLVLACASWYVMRKSPYRSVRQSFAWVAVASVAQVAIGIFAALSNAALSVAALHQLAAVLLILQIVNARFSGVYPKIGQIRGD
ncbi:MAG: COX15/CtaA family protein [Albidovulum sp.]|nr:COX15/CtaA family protein [Albidovulum sp.]MDE0305518.1 COX15/CtaA family protein [Albidovulum sp.]MDE0533421.1 COX15/CtaA family protein [Albidovulum sp.]